jgi:hypothetical protein
MTTEDILNAVGDVLITTSKITLLGMGLSNNNSLTSKAWIEETPDGLPAHDITFDMIGVSPIDDHLTGGGVF